VVELSASTEGNPTPVADRGKRQTWVLPEARSALSFPGPLEALEPLDSLAQLAELAA
jgi:hypothetical protein